MMMGQYGQRFGKYGMARGLSIPEDRPTLAEFLRDHGYVTGQIGKWDIGTKAQGPLTQGFLEVAREPTPKHYAAIKDAPPALRKLGGESKYFCITEDGKEAWLTDYNGDRMIEFVERNKEVPFFLYFSPDAVHSPSDEAPSRLKARTSVDPKNAKRRALGGVDMLHYSDLTDDMQREHHANVTQIDHAFGKLMRIGDWKILADPQLTKFELYNLKTDPQEKTELSTAQAAKLDEMKTALVKLNTEIEAEAPVWKNSNDRERIKPTRRRKKSRRSDAPLGFASHRYSRVTFPRGGCFV